MASPYVAHGLNPSTESQASSTTAAPFSWHPPSTPPSTVQGEVRLGHTLETPPYYRTIGQAQIQALPPLVQDIVNQEIAGPRISVWPLTDITHPTYRIPEGVNTAEYDEARRRAEEFLRDVRGRNIDPAEEPRGPPGGPPRRASSDAETTGTEIRRTARELKLGQTSGFDGTPSKLHQFLQECRLYLQINKDVYDTNDKKVAYVLSLINGGTALLWKEQLLRRLVNDQGDYTFPNINALYQGLEADFKDVDDKEKALEALTTTRQGRREIADHNAHFMLLISRSGLDPDENNTVLVKYYQKSLDPELLTAVWSGSEKPQTIGQWMFVAQEKANHMKTLQNLKRNLAPATHTRNPEPHRRFNVFLKKKFGRKVIRNTEIDESDEPYNDEDPDTEEGEIQEVNDLDLCVVDSEQPACFRCNQVGHFSRDCKQPAKCFNCGQPGHLARNCRRPPQKGRKPQRDPKKTQKVANLVKDLRSMNDVERELFYGALQDDEEVFH
jgi:hypothetical protein